jgi:hypothetical protein
MTATDIISLSLSIISLLVSFWAVFKTNQISNNDIRLSRRSELHNLMQSVEQVLLDKPELALIFKSEQDHKDKLELPPLPVQEAYVFMHLNLFELAYSLFQETRRLNKKELEISSAWDITIEDFFNNCIPAKNIWQEFKSTYYKSFREHVDSIIKKTTAENGVQQLSNTVS